ncbi:MAG: hypothetical protein A2297_08010 [Elusimicrobia bacterium RIFOXYB2_FULL_48_7]|nr:MAG: hypothetical protein A2297_08010 [Elusimicrobia bacterium RIFOXYB2_FULL_48_7]
MRKGKNIYMGIIFTFCMVLLFLSQHKIRLSWQPSYPHFNELITEQNGLQDISGILMGFRCATADIAWVQLIQYSATDEDYSSTMDLLKPLTLRVVRIDPYFHEAYLFSSGILAWFKNVNRPDEAIELLQEGIRNNPKYWQLRLYLSAIVYKKAAKYSEMAALLEEAIQYPDCPSIIKGILANYYKSSREYGKAIDIWENLLTSNDLEYKDRAREQLLILENLTKGKINGAND